MTTSLLARLEALLTEWRTRMPEWVPDSSRILMREYCADQLERIVVDLRAEPVVGEWVSVEDRLPEPDEYVLAATTHAPICMQSMSGRTIVHGFKMAKIENDSPYWNHWQPLPPPPAALPRMGGES